MTYRFHLALLAVLCSLAVHIQAQNTPINLRILWFDDNNESAALQPILDAFEETNPGIQVELDLFNTYINETTLAEQVFGDNPPDLARHTNLDLYQDAYLNLRPYLDDPASWDANFPVPFLAAMRPDPNVPTLHGYPTDITVSAPFINRTLFERAGVPVPSDTGERVSWDAWIAAAAEVQATLAEQGENVYAVTMDRSGHRFWGVSLGQCASYFDATGAFTVDTPGFRDSARMVQNWHREDLTPVDIWGALGDSYIEPIQMFINGEVAFYYSGNWIVPELATRIEDRFEWEPVPNPGNNCGNSGMVGGAVLTAFKTTDHPEAVGKLMSHLTTETNLNRYYTQSNLLPGHAELAARGLDYEENADELNVFAQELAMVQEEAFALQYHPQSTTYHSTIRRGLIEMIVQDLTIEETIDAIETALVNNSTE